MNASDLAAMPHHRDGASFRQWLARAERGAWCCYHIGPMLIGDAATEAMKGARAGKLALAQMRLDPPSENSRFAYLAKRAAVGR